MIEFINPNNQPENLSEEHEVNPHEATETAKLKDQIDALKVFLHDMHSVAESGSLSESEASNLAIDIENFTNTLKKMETELSTREPEEQNPFQAFLNR